MNPKHLKQTSTDSPSPPQLAAAVPSALHAAPVLHGGPALLPESQCTYGFGFSLLRAHIHAGIHIFVVVYMYFYVARCCTRICICVRACVCVRAAFNFHIFN